MRGRFDNEVGAKVMPCCSKPPADCNCLWEQRKRVLKQQVLGGTTVRPATVQGKRVTGNKVEKVQNEGKVRTPSLVGKIVANIFCPTGSGGGVDPTCGTGKSGSGGSAPIGTKAAGSGVGQGTLEPDHYLTGQRKYQYRIKGEKAGDVSVIDKGNGVVRTERLQVERAHRGKGVAKQMYLDLFQELKTIGVKQVISGGTQSPGGQAVWESLKRDGLPIVFTPGTGGFGGTKDSYSLDLSQLPNPQ